MRARVVRACVFACMHACMCMAWFAKRDLIAFLRLQAHESDFTSDLTNAPAALWHIELDDESIGEEDMEEHEVAADTHVSLSVCVRACLFFVCVCARTTVHTGGRYVLVQVKEAESNTHVWTRIQVKEAMLRFRIDYGPMLVGQRLVFFLVVSRMSLRAFVPRENG